MIPLKLIFAIKYDRVTQSLNFTTTKAKSQELAHSSKLNTTCCEFPYSDANTTYTAGCTGGTQMIESAVHARIFYREVFLNLVMSILL